jgi:hypothetical protein
MQNVRSGDEHNPREIELHIEIMIGKRKVLLRIEHFEKSGRWVTAKSCPILSTSSSIKTGLLLPATLRL